MPQELTTSRPDEPVVSRRQLLGAASLAPLAAGLGLGVALPQPDRASRSGAGGYRLTPHIRDYYDAARF